MPTSPAGTRVGGQIHQSKFKIEEDDGEVRHLATVHVAHAAEDRCEQAHQPFLQLVPVEESCGLDYVSMICFYNVAEKQMEMYRQIPAVKRQL